jgi:hypothetical protein
VITWAGGPDGGVAIELELSTKKQAEYERIFRWYAGASDYRRVVWFVVGEALQRRLADLVADERVDDFMRVQPVPAGVKVERGGSGGGGSWGREGQGRP